MQKANKSEKKEGNKNKTNKTLVVQKHGDKK